MSNKKNDSCLVSASSSITAMIEEEMELAAAESKKDEANPVETVATATEKPTDDEPKYPPLTPKRLAGLLPVMTRRNIDEDHGPGEAALKIAEHFARIMWRDNMNDSTLGEMEEIMREHVCAAFRLNTKFSSEEKARKRADEWMANGRLECLPLKSQAAILGYLKSRLLPTDDEKPSEPPATKRPPKKGKAADKAVRRAKLAAKTPPMESMVVPAEPTRELTEEEQLELEIAEEEARREAEEREIEALIAEEEAAKAKAEQAAEAAKAAAKAARGKAKAEARATAKAQKRAA